MCGRTCLSLTKEQIQCSCRYKSNKSNNHVIPDWIPEYNDGKQFIPSYNIPPTSVTPVLLSNTELKNESFTNRILKPMVWGVIPPWHRGDYKKNNLSTNNCRLENILNSKLFGPILRNGGRCIIIAEGFYEWNTKDKANIKQPYYVYPSSSNEDPVTNTLESEKKFNLFYIAGLYSVWQQDSTTINAYSIITMDSNNTLNWLHHRMPAILETEEQIEGWLDTENVNPEIALTYLQGATKLSWHKVSATVNNSKNQSENCRKLAPEKSSSTQKSLTNWFIKVEKRKRNDMANTENKRPK